MTYLLPSRQENQNFPVPYGLTDAAHHAINEHGPFCTEWVTTTYADKPFRRPCLLPLHHTGRHDPRGGRSC